MKICDEKKCTGCGLCTNICPGNAISMKENEYGFLFPTIDESACGECGLCQKKCPTNNFSVKSEFKTLVFAAWNKNKKTREQSSSGGVFSVLAENVLNNGGIVVGVAWKDDFSAYHRFVSDKKDLPLLYGSKYVQSNTTDIYYRIKKELLAEKQILFSGTPCQVHALKCFLGKEYSNLITVDLVCHGIPPYKLLKNHLTEVAGDIKQVNSVFLRYKKPCWNYSSVKIEINNKKTYLRPTVEDAYFNLFNFNYSLRTSCHECKYTTPSRVADITLSDFWGFSPQNLKMRNYDKGISCVMINSEKGFSFFDEIKDKLVFEKTTLQLAMRGNRCLSNPFAAPADVDSFWQDVVDGVSVSELNKRYIKKPYKIPGLLWLRRKKRQYMWLLKRVLK